MAANREVVLDEPELFDEQGDALRKATERAERAEAELAKIKTAPSTKKSAAEKAAPEKAVPARPHPAAQDEALKNPPSPNTAAARGEGDEAPLVAKDGAGGEDELRKDSMMTHLLDSLAAGKDIGHYGRLVFAMVARHFLTHAEVMERLTQDRDFSEEQARLMLTQVEERDYSPPRRDRILAWQAEQEFPILPDADDPDCGNLYRNLTFPEAIYEHIGHYREAKEHTSNDR